MPRSSSKRQRFKTKKYTDEDPSLLLVALKEHQEKQRQQTEAHHQPKKRSRPPTLSQQPESYHSIHHSIRTVSVLEDVMEVPPDPVFGSGLGHQPKLQKPTWEKLSTPSDNRSSNGDSNDGTVSQPIVTCLAHSNDYMAIGNTDGFVHIYTKHPHLISMATLATSASSRELKDQQLLPTNKKGRKYERKLFPNQIQALAIYANRVLLATNQEVELIQLGHHQKTIWKHTIQVPPNKLDLGPNGALISWGNSYASNTPLWIWQTLGGKLLKLDKLMELRNEWLFLGNKCAAIWNIMDKTEFLVVTLLRGDDLNQILAKVHLSTLTIIEQTPIPNKQTAKASVEALSQSPHGNYTLVSSTRGIRLFDTINLQLLQVFGESLVLHGHSLQWQDVLIMPKAVSAQESDWFSQRAAWVLGVPAAHKEPKELRDTLHLWELSDGKHACMTQAGPPKADGLRSLLVYDQQLVLSTCNGECFRMKPTFKSDFSGAMYPPGYRLITENLDYFEDEDEVDNVLTQDALEESEEDDEDFDLKQAMELSMQEQEIARDTVDVVGCVQPKVFALPCQPDGHLKDGIRQGGVMENRISSMLLQRRMIMTSFADILSLIPHKATAEEARALPMKKEDIPKPMALKPYKAKRSKAASLEAQMKAALNPDLRSLMNTKQSWAGGSGSTKSPPSLVVRNSKEETHDNDGKADGEETKQYRIHDMSWVANNLAAVKESLTNGSQGNLVVQIQTGGEEEAETGKRTKNEGNEARSDMPSVSDSCRRGDAAENSLTNHQEAAISQKTTDEGLSGKAKIRHKDTDLKGGANPSKFCGNGTQLGLESLAQDIQEVKEYSLGGENKRDSSTIDAATALLMSASGELESPPKSKQIDSRKQPFQVECDACRGRWVLHSCGTRSKPIDYEAMLKAEKVRLAKEEEEKKKIRAEKRRAADAKRREARKKKKLEEEEKMKEEEKRLLLEVERQRVLGVDKQRMLEESEKHRRTDMLHRLQQEQGMAQEQASAPEATAASAQMYGSTHDWPPPPSFENQSANPAQDGNSQKQSHLSRVPSGQNDWPQPVNYNGHAQPANNYTYWSGFSNSYLPQEGACHQGGLPCHPRGSPHFAWAERQGTKGSSQPLPTFSKQPTSIQAPVNSEEDSRASQLASAEALASLASFASARAVSEHTDPAPST